MWLRKKRRMRTDERGVGFSKAKATGSPKPTPTSASSSTSASPRSFLSSPVLCASFIRIFSHDNSSYLPHNIRLDTQAGYESLETAPTRNSSRSESSKQRIRQRRSLTPTYASDTYFSRPGLPVFASNSKCQTVCVLCFLPLYSRHLQFPSIYSG